MTKTNENAVENFVYLPFGFGLTSLLKRIGAFVFGTRPLLTARCNSSFSSVSICSLSFAASEKLPSLKSIPHFAISSICLLLKRSGLLPIMIMMVFPGTPSFGIPRSSLANPLSDTAICLKYNCFSNNAIASLALESSALTLSCLGKGVPIRTPSSRWLDISFRKTIFQFKGSDAAMRSANWRGSRSSTLNSITLISGIDFNAAGKLYASIDLSSSWFDNPITSLCADTKSFDDWIFISRTAFSDAQSVALVEKKTTTGKSHKNTSSVMRHALFNPFSSLNSFHSFLVPSNAGTQDKINNTNSPAALWFARKSRN
jgi:hypothetical protein